MGFGLLFTLGSLFLSKTATAIEDNKCKSQPIAYTGEGYSISYDSQGRKYINGERINPRYERLPDGSLNIKYYGARSGRLYIDENQVRLNKWAKINEERKNSSIESGRDAYLKYDPILKKDVTCEISTGRIIIGLVIEENRIGYKEYAPIDWDGEWISYENRDPKNKIKITLEEFDKLNIWGPHFKRDDYHYKTVYKRGKEERILRTYDERMELDRLYSAKTLEEDEE